MLNAATNRTPFTIDDNATAHQIPFRASGVIESRIASGTLDPVSRILIILQSFVLQIGRAHV